MKIVYHFRYFNVANKFYLTAPPILKCTQELLLKNNGAFLGASQNDNIGKVTFLSIPFNGRLGTISAHKIVFCFILY